MRTLLTVITLAANLIAAGVPVLHALAHLGHHGEPHHHELAAGLPAAEDADHDHGAVHPAALHDAAAPQVRSSVGFAFVTAADLPVLHAILHERRDLPIPVPRLSTRAPPPGDPARAPPLA